MQSKIVILIRLIVKFYNLGRKVFVMKYLVMITVVLTTVLVSTGVCGLTITYMGQVTQDGVPLESYNMDPVTYDYEDPGVAPLVQLWWSIPDEEDILLHETTVGAGQYLVPVNGVWSKVADTAIPNLGELIYVVAYAGPTPAGLSVTSDVQTTHLPTLEDYLYDFDVLDIPIPEPSVMLLGVMLLLTRKPS
jgi:hypothetical protein